MNLQKKKHEEEKESTFGDRKRKKEIERSERPMERLTWNTLESGRILYLSLLSQIVCFILAKLFLNRVFCRSLCRRVSPVFVKFCVCVYLYIRSFIRRCPFSNVSCCYGGYSLATFYSYTCVFVCACEFYCFISFALYSKCCHLWQLQSRFITFREHSISSHKWRLANFCCLTLLYSWLFCWCCCCCSKCSWCTVSGLYLCWKISFSSHHFSKAPNYSNT